MSNCIVEGFERVNVFESSLFYAVDSIHVFNLTMLNCKLSSILY